jgi:hypothetical protein
MIIYILIFTGFVYAFLKERSMLGCPMLYGECNNDIAKPLKNTMPSRSDDISSLFNKIIKASSWTRNTVYWRRSYIISFMVIIAYSWIFNSRFPTERELLLGMFVLFSILCFSFNFYQFHLNNVAEERIENLINLSRQKIQ